LREKDGTFTVAAALPGVDAKEITVDITPQDVVIKAETEHKHTEDKGQVHRCEFTAGRLFRSLTFPKAVDTAKAKAEYQNGMLNITVPIAPEARAKRVDIKAA
jgi:HSP20 family protein